MVMVKEEKRKVMCTCGYRYTERNPFKCTFECQNATEECVSLNFRKKKNKNPAISKLKGCENKGSQSLAKFLSLKVFKGKLYEVTFQL